jgi:hypothetical protein
MSSLMTLWMGMKVIPELLQGRGLHALYEGTGRYRQDWNINDGTDDLRINLKHVALNGSLKNDPMVLILNHLQIPVKLPHQFGTYCACTVVKISPVVVADDLSNVI